MFDGVFEQNFDGVFADFIAFLAAGASTRLSDRVLEKLRPLYREFLRNQEMKARHIISRHYINCPCPQWMT